MSDGTQNDAKAHKDRFVRWQDKTIAQLGHLINLVFGLAVAALGFSFAIIRDKDFSPGCWGKCFLTFSMGVLLLSIGFSIGCVFNRLCDFRKTESIVRKEQKWSEELPPGEIEQRLFQRREETKRLGKRTWTLCYWQLSTFAVGIALQVAALVMIYQAKLF